MARTAQQLADYLPVQGERPLADTTVFQSWPVIRTAGGERYYCCDVASPVSYTHLLENSIGNKYFMYTAALSMLLVYSFVVIVWQRWNHAERLKQLAQGAADAMNYAQYWKAGAEKATRKHNTHIEKCNRVIEAGESGLPTGDTAEAGALRQQVEGMRIEVLNLTSENKRLRHDLELSLIHI